ncbi:hypothetical protein B1T49_21820 [Mycobacterium persicum]|nr:hypothetical protein B1T49_21820 [Mycobacterium persicum]
MVEHDTLRVVMEPTRNAWVPIGSWFRRRGAWISMVPTTQCAALRAYYSKLTKTVRHRCIWSRSPARSAPLVVDRC